MAKSKRPNRVHGRNKGEQLEKIKKTQDQQRQDRIDAQKKAGTFEGPSMFSLVTRHKTVAYSTLTVIAVLAFVIGPAYYAAIQGGPNQGEFLGDNTPLAKWTTANGDVSVTDTEAINLQTLSQNLQQYITTLIQNAFLNGQSNDFSGMDLDPLAIGFQPIDPVNLTFLSSIANEYNMGVTTEQADAYLQNIATTNTPEQVKAAQDSTLGDSASKRRTLELLAKIISAKQLAQMGGLGVPQAPSISDRWASYKLLTDQHQFEILTVAVNDSIVTAEPSDAELAEMLATGREHLTDDSGLTPTFGFRIDDAIYRSGGARTPTRYQYQFMAINHDAFEVLATKQIEDHIAANDDVLLEYYNKNIETYPAPEKTLDDINAQAEGESDESTETKDDEKDASADKTDKVEASDEAKLKDDAKDESAKEGTAEPAETAAKPESADGCLIQDAAEESTKPPADSEKPTADNPANSDESAEQDNGEDEPETTEDLAGLDTPIPLEPNVDPASLVDPNTPPEPAPFIAQPFEEAHDKVREDYIRTNLPTRVHALIDVELEAIRLAVAAYADSKYGDTAKTNFETVYDAVNKSQTTVNDVFVKSADKHMAAIAVEINNRLSDLLAVASPVTESSEDAEEASATTTSDECDAAESDADGAATEQSETAESADDSSDGRSAMPTITTTTRLEQNAGDILPTPTAPVFIEFHTSPLISAVHGPMISQRNPSSNSFGYEQPITENSPYGGFNENSVSWHKLVRTAYNVHNQPGTPPPSQTLFTTSRFFEVEEKESGEFGTTHTYAYWQINESLSTSFDDITLENPVVRNNLIAGWQLSQAQQDAVAKAEKLVKEYATNGDNTASLSTISTEAGAEPFTTTPTSVLRAGTTGGVGGGMQMVPEANAIYRELTEQQITENVTITDDTKHVARQIPDIYDRAGNAPSAANRIFNQLTVGGAPVIISDSTNRYVYVVRKIEATEPPLADPALTDPEATAVDKSIEGFGTLIQYVRSGTLGPGAFSQFMNAGATDAMYRGTQQAPGTTGLISSAFRSYLQQAHDFEYISPN